MDGLLDVNDILNIKRKHGRWVPQICKYFINNTIDRKFCGGKCPLFGIPNEMGMQTSLQICENRTLCFDNFEIE